MKRLSLSLTAALLLSSGAIAQTAPPPNTTEDAPPSAKTAPENPESNASSSSPGTISPTTADGNQTISQTCDKRAADKKLTGDDKVNFIKQCKQGRTRESS
jgi:hypothetical protein